MRHNAFNYLAHNLVKQENPNLTLTGSQVLLIQRTKQNIPTFLYEIPTTKRSYFFGLYESLYLYLHDYFVNITKKQPQLKKS